MSAGAESEPHDIAIVGGGMVGASLAVALEGLGRRVALIEAVPHDAAAQPSFDDRTTALSNGSRRILETLGVWRGIGAEVSPIARIHVSDRGHFGFARIDAEQQGLGAMGYVVPNRVLGAALWSRLAQRRDVRVYCPAKVVHIETGRDGVDLHVVTSNAAAAEPRSPAESRASAAAVIAGDAAVAPPPVELVHARLVIAADGIASVVRTAFGVGAQARDYEQSAIITTVLPRKFHAHTAYERFTPTGPLALLPLADGRCTLVLTLTRELAQVALGWSDEQFLAEVQERFGFRLGRFLKVGRRVAYPLSLTRAERTSSGRCIIVGNAAQGLHPVAGMGFNLGLRDVATLAELLSECDDLEALPAIYDAWRAGDRREIIAFTDGLVRLFASPFGPVRRLRNLALLAFDLLPPAKAALASLSTGAGGRIPKLARGVPLRRADGEALRGMPGG